MQNRIRNFFYLLICYFYIILVNYNIYGATAAGILLGFNGAVTIKGANGGMILNPALRQRLYNGDKITTGNGGSARALIRNGDVVMIAENSQFTFRESLRESDDGEIKHPDMLELVAGKVRIILKKISREESDFEVVTPTALCGVRGTDFIVLVRNLQETDVLVIEGNVEVRNRGATEPGEPVYASAGEMAVVKEDMDVPEIRKTDKSDIEQFLEGVELLNFRRETEDSDMIFPDNTLYKSLAKVSERESQHDEQIYMYGPSKDMLLPGLVEMISLKKKLKAPPPISPPPPP